MVALGGLKLETPVMNAAGTLSYENLEDVKDVYGAVVTKTVTWEPREGNPSPALSTTEHGFLNWVGLKNPGFEVFAEEVLPEWDVGLPIIVSVWGGDWLGAERMCEHLDKDERVVAVELNLSCPNAECPTWPVTAALVCREVLSKPLIVKLGWSPELSALATRLSEYGVSALTLINTIPALSWDSRSSEPFLGGLSGPAIKPIALRAVYEVSRRVGIPVIGCGGIASGEDVAEFVRAGAAAVQIGSGSFIREPRDILREWEELA